MLQGREGVRILDTPLRRGPPVSDLDVEETGVVVTLLSRYRRRPLWYVGLESGPENFGLVLMKSTTPAPSAKVLGAECVFRLPDLSTVSRDDRSVGATSGVVGASNVGHLTLLRWTGLVQLLRGMVVGPLVMTGGR